MGQLITVELDIAKSVFQVHGVDAEGAVIIRQRLTRGRLRFATRNLSPAFRAPAGSWR